MCVCGVCARVSGWVGANSRGRAVELGPRARLGVEAAAPRGLTLCKPSMRRLLGPRPLDPASRHDTQPQWLAFDTGIQFWVMTIETLVLPALRASLPIWAHQLDTRPFCGGAGGQGGRFPHVRGDVLARPRPWDDSRGNFNCQRRRPRPAGCSRFWAHARCNTSRQPECFTFGAREPPCASFPRGVSHLPRDVRHVVDVEHDD